MRWFHLAVIVLFVAAIVVFAIQNLHVVDVSFLRISFHTRLAFLIAIIYLLGAATGGSLLALVRRSFEGARQRPRAAS
jgi:putative membrane protein